MNLCILYGQIISKIEFNFFYNNKEHISVVTFLLIPKQKVISNETEKFIIVKAYDEIADIIYQNYKMLDYIYLEGYVKPKHIEVMSIENVDL